jgi:hypothetical protein
MIINDNKWQEIIAATRAGIDKWNVRAREKARPDKFAVNVQRSGDFEILLTEHNKEGYTERKVVMRNCVSGELRPAKAKKTAKGLFNITSRAIPKAWARLADKPADEIIRALKLTNFIMILGASVVPQVRTAEGLISHYVHSFRRDAHNVRVCMIVDVEGYNGGHAIAEKIAGPEYCFHAASNLNVLVPDHVKNRLFTTAEELEELYTAVPELRPRDQSRRAAGRR